MPKHKKAKRLKPTRPAAKKAKKKAAQPKSGNVNMNRLLEKSRRGGY